MTCSLYPRIAEDEGRKKRKLPKTKILKKTSTTPSCFNEQKYNFWPIRTRFDPFKWTPRFIFFSNIRVLSFIVTLSLLAKNAVPMMKSVTFGSLEPLLFYSKAPSTLLPFWKGPLTHQKRKFSKMIFFTVFLSHIEPTYQKNTFL